MCNNIECAGSRRKCGLSQPKHDTWYKTTSPGEFCRTENEKDNANHSIAPLVHYWVDVRPERRGEGREGLSACRRHLRERGLPLPSTAPQLP